MTVAVFVCAQPVIATIASIIVITFLDKMFTLGHLQTSLHGTRLITFLNLIIIIVMIVETSMSLLRHLVQILFYLAGDVLLQLLCALVVMKATRFVEFLVLVTVHV